MTEISEEEKERRRLFIEEVKKRGLEELEGWKAYRAVLIAEAEAANPTESYSITKNLFDIADQLSEVVKNVMNIQHPQTPMIVGICSAVVCAVTHNDNIFDEVERLLQIRRDRCVSQGKTH